MKAAYIFNFSKFVTWKQQIDDTIVVCLDTVNELLIHQLKGLEGKPVADKYLHISKFDRTTKEDVASHCHILYSDIHAESLSLKLHRVLVVTDSMELNSIIAFHVNNGKLSFEINAGRAEANDLHISSKLLQLASKVYR